MFNIAQFIAMDKHEWNAMADGRRRSSYTYTESGQLIAPIGSYIPLIVKNYGCQGYAVIKSITIEKNTTTFEFTVKTIDTDAAKGVYAMYMSFGGHGSSGDKYEDASSANIPGLYQGKRSATSVDMDDDDDDDGLPMTRGFGKHKNW